jgi:hypothetical protein
MSLLLYYSLPSLLFILAGGSSLALGLMAAVMLMALLVARRTPIPLKLNRLQAGWLAVAMLSTCALLPWSISSEVVKQIGAIFALGLAFILTNVMVWHYHDRPAQLQHMIASSFAGFAAIALISMILPVTPGRYALLNQPMFPFGEPSHFALAFLPSLISTTILARPSARIVIILSTFAAALLLPSTTLAIGAIIAAGITFSRRLSVTLPVGALLLVGALISAPNYFKTRLTLNTESQNLSALVYLQGLLAAKNGVLETHGLGFGFQLLGTEPPNEATDLIELIASSSFNRMDGGFLAAKIVAEFGAMGVAILAIFTAIAIRALIQLIKLSQLARHERRQHVWQVFRLACQVALLPELYVRGYGYFSPGFMLFMSSFSFSSHMLPRCVPRPLTRAMTRLRGHDEARA